MVTVSYDNKFKLVVTPKGNLDSNANYLLSGENLIDTEGNVISFEMPFYTEVASMVTKVSCSVVARAN